ncbi:thioredoxin-like 4, chloroplastic isoform X2 [Rhodamnia argentea]|uniref:Thioredoxin-like 4, chloroplastic n=1 Tax=Rhodamnia argentea TaxID=178133 RepID=A0A8B8PSZ0_9MYRT|nr:thioredoxin-like 4, chloroplastic isoform X2 [Rhodamnia argentea]XP_048129373.1 thioredoxin-like 4, chloroplastic isoform X2 [Rhodamnia argentea]
MQKTSIFDPKAPFGFHRNHIRQYDHQFTCTTSCCYAGRDDVRSSAKWVKVPVPSTAHSAALNHLNVGCDYRMVKFKCVAYEDQGKLLDEDDDLCPVDCVREFKTDEEFFRILEKAKETDALVVVDFYRTSCGSCKYIEQGFAKLCRLSGDQEAQVIFLKHNVIDEYDEESEVAERLRIRAVPLFHFYKNGVLLEAFPTRDKDRITEAILKYSSSALAG